MDFLLWLLIAALTGMLSSIGTFFTDLVTNFISALPT